MLPLSSLDFIGFLKIFKNNCIFCIVYLNVCCMFAVFKGNKGIKPPYLKSFQIIVL